MHIEDISAAFAAVLVAPREAIHNQAFNVGSNDQNYRVRDIADIVREIFPGSSVEYGDQPNHDPRNYRVMFEKLERYLPTFKCRWDARKGAEQLYLAFRHYGLTQEDFQGRRFTRLAQLKFLLESERINSTLRWNNHASCEAA